MRRTVHGRDCTSTNERLNGIKVSGTERWQFDLRGVLGFMLVVALSLALWREISLRTQLAESYAELVSKPLIVGVTPVDGARYDIGVGKISVHTNLFVPHQVSSTRALSARVSAVRSRDGRVIASTACGITKLRPHTYELRAEIDPRQQLKEIQTGYYLVRVTVRHDDDSAILGQANQMIEFTDRQQHPLSSEDFAVLDAVLSDLVTYDGQDIPISLGEPSVAREIRFSRSSPQLREPQPLEVIEENGGFSILGDGLVMAATTDLLNRLSSEGSFDAYSPRNSRVRVVGDEETLPVNAYLPGYSDDASRAVVHLRFPDIYHSSVGTYVLSRSRSGWKILFRGFINW